MLQCDHSWAKARLGRIGAGDVTYLPICNAAQGWPLPITYPAQLSLGAVVNAVATCRVMASEVENGAALWQFLPVVPGAARASPPVADLLRPE
ncbi:hypothetical protein CHELA1G11_13257 [Hyphomicrobiales bacterium]|nr:hypothetical protein CHELA1G2_11055 [Hyphomicrobiales bacterium]CAH1670402.1 hypothetical protein CHELA1G11_13257 [Hyphomicrobiales bacterium]